MVESHYSAVGGACTETREKQVWFMRESWRLHGMSNYLPASQLYLEDLVVAEPRLHSLRPKDSRS